MLEYFKQNKVVIMVSLSLFVVSMSTLFFFFGTNISGLDQHNLKTDIIEGLETHTENAAENEVNQSDEEKYRKILNNQEDPVFVMNIDGSIKFSSANIEEGLGYKHEEINGKVFFLFLNPEDLGPFLSSFGKVIQTQKPVSMVGPYRMRDKNGQYHLHIGSLVPVIKDDTIEEIAVSWKDIGTKGDHEKMHESTTHELEKTTTAPSDKKIPSEKNRDHVKLMAERM